MSLRQRPFFAGSDDLLLGGHVLLALETGRMRMHAADYEEISTWLADMVDDMETAIVLRLRREGPPALQDLAENALHARGEPEWTSSICTRSHAASIWRDLHGRLRDAP
jgi:hypothetical protein